MGKDTKVDKIPLISIVSPVYGCNACLHELHSRLKETLEKITTDFEIILVNDASPDNAWETIVELAKKDNRVKGINLSRNFGQHSAIMAGIDSARGNWLVIMDCDLQDRPEEIPRLWAKAQEGHDAVIGCRAVRQDGLLKRLSSRAFHWIFDYMTDQESDTAQANFGIYSRRVIDVIKTLPEQPRFLLLLVRWAGFKVIPIEIVHDKRLEGKSSYNFSRKFSLATNSIVSYSNKPLKMCVQFGFIMAFAAFCYGVWLFIRYFLFDLKPTGWTSMMVSLYFLSGILLVGMGILGVYIGRIFNQVKERPLYVVKDRTPISAKVDSV